MANSNEESDDITAYASLMNNGARFRSVSQQGEQNDFLIEENIRGIADISKESPLEKSKAYPNEEEGNTQMFRASDKISTVLRDSGPFDDFNDSRIMKHRIRALEIEKLALMVDHNKVIGEFNRSVQNYIDEIRSLRDTNKLYEQEINELKDLSCFLDDERRKYKKIAKEWQKFGTRIVYVLKREVSVYQNKLISLASRHDQLFEENIQLRSVCEYLKRADDNVTNEPGDHYKEFVQYGSSQKLPNRSSSNCEHEKPSTSTSNYNTISHAKEQQDLLAEMEEGKRKLKRLLIANKEKKHVSFDFPDDSDTSTSISDLDSSLDFPPAMGDIENHFDLDTEPSTSSRCESESASVTQHLSKLRSARAQKMVEQLKLSPSYTSNESSPVTSLNVSESKYNYNRHEDNAAVNFQNRLDDCADITRTAMSPSIDNSNDEDEKHEKEEDDRLI